MVKKNIFCLAVAFSDCMYLQNKKTEYVSSHILTLFHTWKLLHMKLKDRQHLFLQAEVKRIAVSFLEPGKQAQDTDFKVTVLKVKYETLLTLDVFQSVSQPFPSQL